MRRLTYILLLAYAVAIGCMPYASEFSCPKSGDGSCGSLPQAYENSVVGYTPKMDKSDKKEEGKSSKDNGDTSYLMYRDSLHNKLSGLLKEPVTPVLNPPTVMRVLLLPYVGEDNELYTLRYAYLLVNEFKWVVGDYLRESPDSDNTGK